MNSFAHALPFLTRDAFYCIGCAIPDWLGAVDRRCRVRKNGAADFLDSDDVQTRSLAAGIIQHIDDDRWFHQGEAFVSLSIEFSVELRELLVDDPGFRPGFMGHIIIELLLDAFLHENNPGKLDEFYRIVGTVDPISVENRVNAMATRPTEKLKDYFSVFLKVRYLFDYNDDRLLLDRTNNVLRRVKLKPVPDSLMEWVPGARERVYDSAAKLLSEFAGPIAADF